MKHGGIATTEELFGPVISIFYVKDADEAIAKANNSEYALGATVYTKSLEIAMKAMENDQGRQLLDQRPVERQ